MKIFREKTEEASRGEGEGGEGRVRGGQAAVVREGHQPRPDHQHQARGERRTPGRRDKLLLHVLHPQDGPQAQRDARHLRQLQH